MLLILHKQYLSLKFMITKLALQFASRTRQIKYESIIFCLMEGVVARKTDILLYMYLKKDEQLYDINIFVYYIET